MIDLEYGYGSQWHLLRYLGRHRRYLQEQILRIENLSRLQPRNFEWLDTPFDATHWTLDGPFRRVDFLNPKHPLRQQWPTCLQPRWDAVVRLHVGGLDEVLLVVATAHTNELIGHECALAEPERTEILKHLARTKARLGTPGHSDWLGSYFRYVQHLTSLRVLLDNEFPARLLLIYFFRDESSDPTTECPADMDEWGEHLAQMNHTLGIPEGLPGLADWVHTLFLPVSPNSGTHHLVQWPWFSPREET